MQDSSSAVRDEESCVHRALMKYLDAWSLSPNNWEYNLHVGRLLLLQGRSREALQHLQSGLAQHPLHPALRSGHKCIVGSRSRSYIVSVALIVIITIILLNVPTELGGFTEGSHIVVLLIEK